MRTKVEFRPKLIIGVSVISVSFSCIIAISLLQLAEIEKPMADFKNTENDLEVSVRMIDFTTDMKYYDEVLTQSARNYAFTKDTKWKDRYLAVEPKLDEIIKKSIRVGGNTVREFFANIEDTNIALVDLEHRSIELVDKNMASEAIDLLEGERYQILKNIYSQNIDNIMNKYKGDGKISHYEHIQTADSLLQNTAMLLQNSITMLVISTPVFIITIIIFTSFVTRQKKNIP